MGQKRAKIRLYVEAELGARQAVPVSREQANYLFNVMRLGVGDRVALFNGRDGEWSAVVEEAGKRRGVLACVEQSAPQVMPPDLWLIFAPIKKARTDFIVEKACELGAAFVQPVITQYTNSDRVRVDKLRAHAMEAAEQCGGTFVPPVGEPVGFEQLLNDWDPARRLLFCDERMEAPDVAAALRAVDGKVWSEARVGASGVADVGGISSANSVGGTAEEVAGAKVRAVVAAVGEARAEAKAGETADEAAEDVAKSNAGKVVDGDVDAKAGAGTEVGPWAILIGPEGGFSEAEVEKLRARDFVTSVTLGPRVLRADTAAVAAITIWQSILGDWV